jgi:hypothetical protein
MSDWERWNAECKWCGEEYKGDICERLAHDFHCGGSSQFTPAAVEEIESLRTYLAAATAERGEILLELKQFSIANLDLTEERDRLREALEEIAKPKYGIDGHETDDELVEYFAKKSGQYEAIARASLSHGGKP